jgi:hypothetical protein
MKQCEPCTWWHQPKIAPVTAHYQSTVNAKIALCERHADIFRARVKENRLAGEVVDVKDGET